LGTHFGHVLTLDCGGIWRSTGALTLIALFLGDVDTLGKALGVCVVAMAVLFGICAATVTVSPGEFGRGLVVPLIPPGSSITVLSLVSTTGTVIHKQSCCL
jgi:hypothetical protein